MSRSILAHAEPLRIAARHGACANLNPKRDVPGSSGEFGDHKKPNKSGFGPIQGPKPERYIDGAVAGHSLRVSCLLLSQLCGSGWGRHGGIELPVLGVDVGHDFLEFGLRDLLVGESLLLVGGEFGASPLEITLASSDVSLESPA